tara:strand:- start:535 stop:900 length:366 start_codon:yes stop_codon:yes gene_type:complete
MTFILGEIIAAPYYSNHNKDYLRNPEHRTLLYPARVIAVPRGHDSIVIKYLDGIPSNPIALSGITFLPIIHLEEPHPHSTVLCKGFYDQVHGAPAFEPALARYRRGQRKQLSKPVINYQTD